VKKELWIQYADKASYEEDLGNLLTDIGTLNGNDSVIIYLKKEREKKSRLPDKKFLEDHLDVVNEEIENLNRLVMDFLFAVRPINARLVLVNPSKLIENIVSFFSPAFGYL